MTLACTGKCAKRFPLRGARREDARPYRQVSPRRGLPNVPLPPCPHLGHDRRMGSRKVSPLPFVTLLLILTRCSQPYVTVPLADGGDGGDVRDGAAGDGPVADTSVDSATPPLACASTETVDRACDDFERATAASPLWNTPNQSGGGALGIVALQPAGSALRLTYPTLASGASASAFLSRSLRPNVRTARFTLRARRESGPSTRIIAIMRGELKSHGYLLSFAGADVILEDKCDCAAPVRIVIPAAVGQWHSLTGSVAYTNDAVAMSLSAGGAAPITAQGKTGVPQTKPPLLTLGSDYESGPDSANEILLDDFTFEGE